MAQRTVWHREDIKAELRKRFGALSALSQDWGYNPSAIGHVLAAPRNSLTLTRRIAEALNVPPHHLWPELWLPNGQPQPNRIARRSDSAGTATKNSQKRSAA